MNQPTVSNPRIYDLARANQVASRYILAALNTVLTNSSYRSASSRVEIKQGNEIFWESVVSLALVKQNEDTLISVNLSEN